MDTYAFHPSETITINALSFKDIRLNMTLHSGRKLGALYVSDVSSYPATVFFIAFNITENFQIMRVGNCSSTASAYTTNTEIVLTTLWI